MLGASPGLDPVDLSAVPTAKLARRFGRLDALAQLPLGRCLGRHFRFDVLAARVEEELDTRARRVHPLAFFDGQQFQIPFPRDCPLDHLSVPAGQFDRVAAELGGHASWLS